MVIETRELGVRVGLGHEEGAGPVAAADVGDRCTLLELCHHAVERGQPRTDQVVIVAGTKESLGAAEQAAVLLVPAKALAALECVGNARFGAEAGGDDVEETGEEGRALLVVL